MKRMDFSGRTRDLARPPARAGSGVPSDSEAEWLRRIRAGKSAKQLLESGAARPTGKSRGELEECLESGKEAWAKLFSKYVFCVQGFIGRRRLRPGSTSPSVREIGADEFTNEVYVQMWDRCKLATYRGKAPFEHWFNVVLRTIYADAVGRLSSGRRAAGPDPGDPEGTPAGANGRAAEEPSGEHEAGRARTFERCVAQLPDTQRVVYKCVYMYYLTLSAEEVRWIAKRTNRSVAGVIADLRGFYNTVVAPRAQEAERWRERLADLHRRKIQAQMEPERIEAELERLPRPITVSAGRVVAGAGAMQATGAPRTPELPLATLVEQRHRLEEAAERREQEIERLREKLKKPVRAPSRDVGKLLGMRQTSVDSARMRASAALSLCLKKAPRTVG